MNHQKPFRLRPLESRDQDFLFAMLYEAIYTEPGAPRPDRSLVDRPELRKYVEHWGREGDIGLIALDGQTGEPVGAVWARLFDESAKGYGFVGKDVPEISMAVRAEKRGQGVGSALLWELLQREGPAVKSFSLSVDPGNPAKRLYERMGFRECGTAGTSVTMRFDRSQQGGPGGEDR